MQQSPAPLRFLLNGEPVTVTGVPPQATLLEYLREHGRCTGTKEGCAEGDCGACTVVLAEAIDGRLDWKPVNACIRLLPSVAGKAVFTVESLRSATGALHPVQQALVDCHGSQCGFCTPGFAMSLFGLYKNALRPSRGDIEDALSGNLCRCTGYRPIVAAAQAMYATAAAGWRGPGIAPDGSRTLTPEEEALAMQAASLGTPDTLAYESHGRRWWSPRTSKALAAILDAHPGARIVAGATDVGLWITKHHRDVGDIVYTGDVADLKVMRTTATHVEIGAAVTLTDAFAALDATWPELHEAWARFASVPIRNSGTLGGNIANGSPIGDSMPVLLALDARLVLRRGDTSRELPLADFYLAYQKTALERGEFVAHVRIPLRMPPHAAARLQDQQALRPGHFGGLRVLCVDARRRSHRSRAHRLRRRGGHAQTRHGHRSRARRTRVGRSDGRRRRGRTGQRIHADRRHARKRRIQARRAREPVPPLPPRNVRRDRADARRAGGRAVHRRCTLKR